MKCAAFRSGQPSTASCSAPRRQRLASLPDVLAAADYPRAPGHLLGMSTMATPRARLYCPAPLSLSPRPACGGTPFCTTATYAAPSSGLTRWIGSPGTVSPAAPT